MKSKLIIVTCLFGLILSLVAAPLRAVKCEQPPELDGKLDDGCWQKALVFSDFKILNTGAPAFPVEARLLYGNEAIYVGFKIVIPEGGTLKADAEKGSSAVYSDDCVEVMIDPNATATRYFHFVANANGALLSYAWDQGGYVGGRYESNARAAGFKGQGFWSCEIEVPLYCLDINPDGTAWAFNFAHGARNPYQDSSIAEMGIFHNAGKFVSVEDFELDLPRFAWEQSKPELVCKREGDSIAAVASALIGNSAPVEQPATFNLVLIRPKQDETPTKIYGTSISEKFSGQSHRTVQFPKILVHGAGEYRCVLSAVDPHSQQILKRNYFRLSIEYAPFAIRLTRPNYRNMIFASQRLANVEYSISSVIPVQELVDVLIITGICDENGKVLCDKKIEALDKPIFFPAAALPDGKLSVFVKASRGEERLGEATHPLRKLPFKAGEVWRDEQGIWHVEDKPFFLIGAWGESYISGVNATVGDFKVPGVMRLQRNIVYEPRFVDLTRVPAISPEDCKYLAGIYEKMSRIPNLFAHYMVDEPEISGCTVMALTQNAEIAREVDPYHPVLCSNNSIAGNRHFYDTAEINGIHPYPQPRKDRPRNDFKRVVTFLDHIVAYGKTQDHPQTIAFLQQGFNYGDCGAANTCVPTFDEARTQYLISLAMGGNAILYFNFCTDHYYEFSVGHPEIAQEMVALSPAMTVPDETDLRMQVDHENIRFRVKKVGEHYWLLACSTIEGTLNATFKVPGLAGRKLQVFREGRFLEVSNDCFSDTFTNYDARVYTTDQRDFGLRPLAAVEAEIARLNESRRKPGNLAFQMFEHDLLKIYASSNRLGGRTPDSVLWHVTDGIMGGKSARHGNDKGRMVWCDNTPGETPDWIVLEFPDPITAGRIAVYPAEGTLKAYDVQVEVDGEFKTVGSVTNLTSVWDEHQQFQFEQVRTSKIRLYVTANHGPDSKVHEIEVYEK